MRRAAVFAVVCIASVALAACGSSSDAITVRGDRVVRVTWSQAMRDPQQTALRIRSALEQARRAYPPNSSR